jgi:hypothetical protein
MKIQTFKRLNKNDYPEEYRDLIDQLSFIINDGFETLYNTLDGRVNPDNTLTAVKDAQVIVNESGIPQSRVNISLENTKVKKAIGCMVISIINANNPIVYPEAGVTVSWVQEGNSVTVNHLTGLQANTPWVIRFYILGGS